MVMRQIIGGGGYASVDIIVEPFLFDESYTTTRCYDDYKWTSAIHKFNCSAYVSTVSDTDYNEKCDSYGHLKSDIGFSAIEACCGCVRLPNLDEADLANVNGLIQGGYTGILTGKVIRVGYPQHSDVNYTFYIDDHDVKRGTIPEFMAEVANAHGFGLIEAHISEESTSLFPNDSYSACLSDLSLSRVDICAGS